MTRGLMSSARALAAVAVAGVLVLACAETSSGNGSTGATGGGPSVVGADVTEVVVRGDAGAYTFAVTVRSPDTGCERYADWWEVVTPEGELLTRRILTHSHVDEQPFTRSGGPIAAADVDRLIVRAHMNDTGYGGVAFSGSVADGFTADPSVTDAFAPGLAETPPLPVNCAF